MSSGARPNPVFANTLQSERWLTIKYAVLTLAIFLPLLWSFRWVTNVYPITTWNMMMVGGQLERSWNYSIVSGETVSGEKVEIRPAHLTNALYARSWGLVNATIENRNFKLDSLHPSNAELLSRVGGIENLPAGARLPEVLQAWGKIYNEQYPASSPQRLKSIQVDMYSWQSGHYDERGTLVQTWRKEL